MIPHATRAVHLVLMLLILGLMTGLALDGDLDARKRKRNRDRKPNRPHQTIEIRSGSVPWAGEGQVSIRYRGSDRYLRAAHDAYEELVQLTAHMPKAPEWVWVDMPYQDCARMDQQASSGVNICTAAVGGADAWGAFFWPAGCPKCGAAHHPVKAPGGSPDGWESEIFLEDTNYLDPNHPNECGWDHNERCSGPIVPDRTRMQNIVLHELAHAVLDQGHVPLSATSNRHPWGIADFAKAEKMFGKSSVPFCDLYPTSPEC
jgi:hypothetical protein